MEAREGRGRSRAVSENSWSLPRPFATAGSTRVLGT